MKRKTLNREVQYNGIGLHKGEEIKMRLVPAQKGGIIFKRVDLEEGKNIISMSLENTFDLTRGTNLKNEFGAAVYTIEHFLSALYIAEITDLVVELDGNELPIGDGSAKVFIEVIESVGVKELEEEIEEIVIKSPLNLTVGDKHIVALPFDGYKVTYTIKFD
ncbi:MAG: UDP-3-O-acyl-N-acetylglucosamine deacetylase, partial [Cetobacterium sp.]